MRRMLLTVGLLVLPALALAADEAPGAALFQAACKICHQLPDPAQLKAKQWELVLEVMQQRLRQKGLPPLDESTKQAIASYLAQNARR